MNVNKKLLIEATQQLDDLRTQRNQLLRLLENTRDLLVSKKKNKTQTEEQIKKINNELEKYIY